MLCITCFVFRVTCFGLMISGFGFRVPAPMAVRALTSFCRCDDVPPGASARSTQLATMRFPEKPMKTDQQDSMVGSIVGASGGFCVQGDEKLVTIGAKSPW